MASMVRGLWPGWMQAQQETYDHCFANVLLSRLLYMHVFTHRLVLFSVFFQEASHSCGWQLMQRFISGQSVKNKSDDGWEDIYIIPPRLMDHQRKGDEGNARAGGWVGTAQRDVFWTWHGCYPYKFMIVGLTAQNLHKIRSSSISLQMERASWGTTLPDRLQQHPRPGKRL